MLHWGLLAAAHRLPFLPIRAGLGSDVLRVNPELRTVRSPYDDGEELVAMPALRLDAALVHLNRADAAGNGQYLGPDPYFDDLFCLAAGRGLPVLRADRADRRACWSPGRRRACWSTGPWCTAWSRRPAARTSPAACRTTAATRRSRPGTRRRPPTPDGLAALPRPSTWPATRPATSRRSGGYGRQDGKPYDRRAEPGPRSAWWRAPRRGAATARSWPARWA